MVSVGGLSESVVKQSSSALLRWVRDRKASGNRRAVAALGTRLVAMFAEAAGEARVVVPLLKTVEARSAAGTRRGARSARCRCSWRSRAVVACPAVLRRFSRLSGRRWRGYTGSARPRRPALSAERAPLLWCASIEVASAVVVARSERSHALGTIEPSWGSCPGDGGDEAKICRRKAGLGQVPPMLCLRPRPAPLL